jgi:hypothetical protein
MDDAGVITPETAIAKAELYAQAGITDRKL